MKTIGKILYITFITILVCIVGIFVAASLPIPGNIEVKIVKSGSMEPSIMTGAIVVVKPSKSYVVGDVVTFGEDTKQQIPTTHRIISITEKEGKTFFMTKGDANEEADATEVSKDEVIGKILFDVPYLGYVLDFARQPIGFALLIGVPAIVIIIDESGAIIKEIGIMRRKRRGEIEYENL
jgi:signal peptidase